MKIDRRKKPEPRALSITQYALIFFFILFLVAAGLVWATLRETETLKQETIASQNRAALREIDIANSEITQIAERVAQALTNWDEVRQQLVNPTFYALWRSSRAISAGKIPIALHGIDLYDKNGNILKGSVKSGSEAMPPQILSSIKRAALVKEDRDFLYYFFPIRVDDNALSTHLGYAGIKLDYLATLRALRPLRYVDVNTITIPGRKGEVLDLTSVVTRAQFKLNRAPEFEGVENIMVSSLYRLSLWFGILSVVAYLMITSLVTLPLRQLGGRIKALREDQGSLLNASYRGLLPVSELEQLRLSFNEYQVRLEDMHHSLENKNKELWTLAHHDPLTGAFNRRAFEQDWKRFTTRAAKQSTKMALLLLDCDRFKAINDTYGHQTGDLVLQALVLAVQAALREMDRLYRLGGDEFAILLFDTNLEDAKGVASRFLDGVANYDFTALGIKEPVGISVGLAYWPGGGVENLLTLHKQADLAMYHAKKPGQAKLVVYQEALAQDTPLYVFSQAMGAVEDAITSPSNGMLELNYQKVVRLPACQTDYYETLVRIHHGDVLLLPADIFPIVEGRHLEIEFDLAILEAMRATLARGEIPPTSGVAVNLCASAIVSDKVIDKVMELAPFLVQHLIVIEITETALITQMKRAPAGLVRLRKAGFKIALDDFGRAYSSLSYLANMPVDIIKFDRSLLRGVEEQGRAAKFVTHLARLVSDLGYDSVAKGIENPAMLLLAIEIGFTHAQGYELGAPQRFPAEA